VAVGLPVKIVVLTIVGMAGLAAMLSVIDNGQRAIPGMLHADLKGNSLIILSSSPDILEFPVEVADSKDGTGLEKASVVLSGPNVTAINVTGRNGRTILRINRDDIEMDTGEGYLELVIKASGFQDYSNEYAVKVVK
jgi:hypothetical protein